MVGSKAGPPSQRDYWSFYWPLALTGLAMALATQFQNGALARYPDAVRELAIFALAQSTFQFFNAALAFTPQLANVYARSEHGFRTSMTFIMLTTTGMMAIQGFLALTSPGRAFIAAVYDLDGPLLARVTEYLALLMPILLLNAARLYLNGTLVQARLTGWVTALNVLFLATTIAVLLIGFRAGWHVTYTLVGAQAAGALMHLLATLLVRRAYYRWPEVEEHTALGYLELVKFFVPVTTNGVMFALSRPVLYAFVGRTPQGLLYIAALRVGFDFSAMFQQAANQFRHFFVTFGLDDLAGKRRFMVAVCAGITLIMLLVAVTPASDWVLGGLLGIEDEVKARSVEVILVMCLLPTLIMFRNYFHGLLLVKRRTVGMATGGILRVVGIYLLAQLLYTTGTLDHMTAALVLVAGFGIEALTVLRAGRMLPAD